jgi:hypothetical protein
MLIFLKTQDDEGAHNLQPSVISPDGDEISQLIPHTQPLSFRVIMALVTP